jgi:hypothetical protein
MIVGVFIVDLGPMSKSSEGAREIGLDDAVPKVTVDCILIHAVVLAWSVDKGSLHVFFGNP